MSGARPPVPRADIGRHPTHGTCDTRGVGLHRLRQDTGPPGDLRLESLQESLYGLYEVSWAEGMFWAVPLFTGPVVEAETLEGLESATRAALARRQVTARERNARGEGFSSCNPA